MWVLVFSFFCRRGVPVFFHSGPRAPPQRAGFRDPTGRGSGQAGSNGSLHKWDNHDLVFSSELSTSGWFIFIWCGFLKLLIWWVCMVHVYAPVCMVCGSGVDVSNNPSHPRKLPPPRNCCSPCAPAPPPSPPVTAWHRDSFPLSRLTTFAAPRTPQARAALVSYPPPPLPYRRCRGQRQICFRDFVWYFCLRKKGLKRIKSELHVNFIGWFGEVVWS